VIEVVDQDFQSGDVVMLRSGGPPMTVEALAPVKELHTTIAVCLWFDAGELHHEAFEFHTLKKVNES
jgi:uncharacterized protein YodC (DUF2158 family)